MSKKLYIAYGSNLNLNQMKYRCPTAKLLGVGVVEDYELQFKGMPHCAYATIAPCGGKSVPVALWELQPRDEKKLDRYEGYPSHYFKKDLPVKMNDGTEQTAMVYIMDLKQKFGLPSESYYDTVYQGYVDCGLDTEVLDQAVNDSAKKFYEEQDPFVFFDEDDDALFNNENISDGAEGMSL